MVQSTVVVKNPYQSTHNFSGMLQETHLFWPKHPVAFAADRSMVVVLVLFFQCFMSCMSENLFFVMV